MRKQATITRKPGQPTKYEGEVTCRIARAMAGMGATNVQIAREFGVSEETLNQWRRTHSEFAESLRQSKLTPDEAVEKSLLQRALGYDATETSLTRNPDGTTTIKTTVHHVAPNVTAQIFWLKNRRPDLWRDRQEVEHSGNVTQVHSFEGFSEAELLVAKKRLKELVKGDNDRDEA